MVPPETLGLGKFWPNLEISEAFLMGLEVWFAGGFCIRESLNVFADGSWSLGLVFFLSVWSSGVKFFRVYVGTV